MTTSATLKTSQSSPQAPLPMSYEEWLKWDHEGGLTEWVDGEVIFHMAASILHQQVIGFLFMLLQAFARRHQLGQVLTGPAAMRIKPNGNGREPDIFFVATQNLGRLTDEQLEGPADLVIEVVSDESVSRDRDDKYYEYEEGGVPEYWIIDPRPHRKRAYFYALDENGHYQSVKVGSDGIYRSTVVAGFWLKVDWLWAAELDDVAALMQVVGFKK